jgi:photosynthetic reaction center cytochrome c subunit
MNSGLRTHAILLAAGGCLLLASCERPPVATVQHGYRGTGMEQVYNPRTLAEQDAKNVAPAALPAAPSEGPKAGQIYQNVKVLGDLSVGEFTRTMLAITSWVAPTQGCNYCHNPQNLADDSLYTKVVSRRMLQMTQHINADWKAHVANTGVTCYTCHRGQPVPAQVWFKPLVPASQGLIGNKAGQNSPARSVAYASLPSDPLTPFLSGASEIRVIGTSALPAGNRQSIKQTEWTYGLMMHMSQSLGVNCTYCHNSRSFAEWDQSSPQRVSAWHGIRMARNLNHDYLEPLTSVFPAARLGEGGDVAKISCATCHQGAYKPLYGAPMLKDYPELASSVKAKVSTTTTPAPAAAAVAAPRMAVINFAVGSTELPGDASATLEPLVKALMADPAANVSLSGFHSASGSLAVNEELAKRRAFAVRDMLLAAGVPKERVMLEKPQQTEANIAGEDRQARRVEVSMK